VNKMNPLYTLFYELSKQLEQFFGIQWIKVHQLSENLLSGYGFYKRPEVKMWITDFINLRVSLNPKKYELDCSNESLYARICSVFKMIEYNHYNLYVEAFKELIPIEELKSR
jgi:hypothetical protein